MKFLLNKIIRSLGKKNYKLSEDISFLQLLSISFKKLFDLIRGLMISTQLLKSSKLIFIGERVKILSKQQVTIGKSGNIHDDVKINALSKKGIKIGHNFTLKSFCIIDCTGVYSNLGEGLEIGNNVGISENCFLQVRGFVKIGDDVIIGPGVSIFSENHAFTDKTAPIREQGVTRKGVEIKSGTWIGANATILDGVTLGKNCVVAAGSMVTKVLAIIQ